MIPSDLLDPLRRALEARAASESLAPSPDCLDEDTIGALAEGSLAAESLEIVVGHLARCGSCRVAVASVARALGDPAIAREVAAAERGRERPRWNRLLPMVLPLATAAALLLLVVRPWSTDAIPSEPRHRAPTITGVPAPSATWPLGTVETATLLRWSGVLGADRYRVTLYDGAGQVLYQSQTSDTVTALPDSLRLLPGRRYLWKAEARTGWNRWSASPLAEFSVIRAATP